MQSWGHTLGSTLKKNNITNVFYLCGPRDYPFLHSTLSVLYHKSEFSTSTTGTFLTSWAICFIWRWILVHLANWVCHGKYKNRSIIVPERQLCVVWNTHTMTCALLTCNCSTFPPEVKFRHTKPNFTLHVRLVTLLAWLRYNMILFVFYKAYYGFN